MRNPSKMYVEYYTFDKYFPNARETYRIKGYNIYKMSLMDKR